MLQVIRANPGIRVFVDDDEGYLLWLHAHPTGLVVNARKRIDPTYLILHKASCGTINGKPARGDCWTTGNFVKACSTDLDPLAVWARRTHGGPLTSCGLCRR
jgi:hypothetical protein